MAGAQSTWTNGTTDFLWNTAGNWSAGVPGAGNDAILTGTAPGTISLGTTPSGAATMDLTFSGGDYIISAGGVGGSLTADQLFQSAGVNTISAPLTSAGGASITGGALRLTNTSLTVPNSVSGAWTVGPGGTLDAAFGGVRPAAPGASGSSALGTAAINLNGGTLVFSGQNYDGGTGGLTAQVYAQQVRRNARIEFQSLAGITALFNTSTPETLAAPNAGFTDAITNIDFANTAYGATAPFSTLGNTAVDDVMSTWKGKFIAPTAGTYTFAGNSDDGLMVFVDGQLVVNRNNFQGAATDPNGGTITLSAGAHEFYAAFYEGNGGAGVRVYENDPTTEAAGDPLDLADLTAAQPQTLLGNNVNWNASSTIGADNTYGVTLGSLAANTAGATLTTGRTIIAGQPSPDGLVRFGATTFNAPGPFTFNAQSDIALGTLTDGTNTVTIAKTGPGNLILDSTAAVADTNGTVFDIQQGRLVVQRTNTGNNPAGSGLIQLNGAGTVLQLSTPESVAGNVNFDNAVQVNQNARIEFMNHSATARELILGSATNGISIGAGLTLEMAATNATNPRINGVISGVGSNVRFSASNDAGQQQGFFLINAANSFSGRAIIENGANVRLDAANALNSASLIDLAAGGRLELFGNNTFNSATPKIYSRSGSVFRLNAASNPSTAVASGTLDVGPGRIIEFQTGNAFTGAATVRHAPGAIVQNSTASIVLFPAATTTVGLRAQDFGKLDLIRAVNTINGAGDGVLNAGWGGTGVGTIIQINGADRNITNSAIQELNGQIITQDGANRIMVDGNRLDVNALGGTIGSAATFTLTVNENLLTTVDSGKLTIGAHIPIDNRFLTGAVVFAHPSAGDFTGTTTSAAKAISIVNGATLEGRVSATGASGLGGSAATSAGVALDRGTLRVAQPATAVPNGFANIGQIFATGAGTLQVSRSAAGVVTEMRINNAITRSAGATVGLLSTNNVLGTDERIRFATLASAPTRLSVSGPATIGMVAPWMINTSGNIGSFVDYDPAQDATTGVGFTNATYTTIADEAGLIAATPTTIADVTTAIALTGNRSVGAARLQAGLTGTGFTLTSETGGFIITTNAAVGQTVSANLAAPAGKELVVYSGGATGGIHVVNGTITSDSGLTKFGPRTLQVLGNNSATLTGNITINEASFVINNDNNLGAAANKVILNGGALRPAANLTIAREIVVNNGGGALTNDGNRTIDYSGVISGEGALTISAVNPSGTNFGVNRFTGANPNTFSGGLVISNGILEFSRNDQLGAAPSATDYDSGHVVLNDATTNVTLRLASGAGAVTTTDRQFSILGTGRVEVAGANDTLTIDNDIRGSGGLTKQGPGTLVLSNPEGNAYTGATTIAGGALLANNTAGYGSATGTGAVAVNSSGTLGGSGIVEGAVTVNTGGALSPGASLAAGISGVLRTNGGLTLANDANFKWSLSGLSTGNPGTDFDRVVVEIGALSLTSGANFSFDFATGMAPQSNAFWSTSQTWNDIIQVSGVATAGTLGTFDIDNTAWSALGTFSTVADANGVDLVWTAVPEPGSASILAGALVALGGLRRRGRTGVKSA